MYKFDINYSSIKPYFRPKLSNDLQILRWNDVVTATDPALGQYQYFAFITYLSEGIHQVLWKDYSTSFEFQIKTLRPNLQNTWMPKNACGCLTNISEAFWLGISLVLDPHVEGIQKEIFGVDFNFVAGLFWHCVVLLSLLCLHATKLGKILVSPSLQNSELHKRASKALKMQSLKHPCSLYTGQVLGESGRTVSDTFKKGEALYKNQCIQSQHCVRQKYFTNGETEYKNVDGIRQHKIQCEIINKTSMLH